MFNFKDLIDQEISDIKNMLDLMKDVPKHMPSVVRKRHGSKTYFYLIVSEDGKKKHKYLGTINSSSLKSIANKTYDAILYRMLNENLRKLEDLAASYSNSGKLSVIKRMPAAFENIPITTAADKYMPSLLEWAAGGTPNPTPFDEKFNRACDGTRVRSKGECIWYNILFDAGLPFRYDKGLGIDTPFGHKNEYPDFQILCPNGKLIVIEHLGLLDDVDYIRRFTSKTEEYVNNGYVLQDTLFFTSDDPNHGTDSEVITDIVRKIKSKYF